MDGYEQVKLKPPAHISTGRGSKTVRESPHDMVTVSYNSGTVVS